MSDKKRRVRTGCLTCRARRVKCDERQPQCRRCLTANLDCAGYEQRRVIVPLTNGHDDNPTSIGSLAPDSGSPNFSFVNDANFQLSSGRNSLISFPSNPRSSQNPSFGARHVLGYHQALFRTVPLLFPTDHLRFWRDELFQEAWGHEYLYLTLVALGNIHRAALLGVSHDEHDKAAGLDMKITAVQLYIQALKYIESHLEEAKQIPVLLVASLCLMAYFESLSGNIPAFVGRMQSAHYYFTAYLSTNVNLAGLEKPQESVPGYLEDCLRSLRQTCYVALPLDRLHITNEQCRMFCHSGHREQDRSAPIAGEAIRRLVGIVSEDQLNEQIVWSPIAPYARNTPIDAIRYLERKLEDWKTLHLHYIPELDTDTALKTLLVYKWQRMPMPPPPYITTTRQSSVAAVHFNFYVARAKWALSLLGHDPQQNQLIAEFYFYEALRHAASHVSRLGVPSEIEDRYIPCEALNVGILPVLHIIGLCSPQPSWLEWIKDSCGKIAQEGVLKGHTFATNLHCLHEFEERRNGASLSIANEYSKPTERIICFLVPETSGRHFTSFFAVPWLGIDTNHEGLSTYRVIGHARWECGHGEHPCTPLFEIYEEEDSLLDLFSIDWLNSTRVVQEWLSWSRVKEFRMDRALQDHISGTRLSLAVDDTSSRMISTTN